MSTDHFTFVIWCAPHARRPRPPPNARRCRALRGHRSWCCSPPAAPPRRARRLCSPRTRPAACLCTTSCKKSPRRLDCASSASTPPRGSRLGDAAMQRTSATPVPLLALMRCRQNPCLHACTRERTPLIDRSFKAAITGGWRCASSPHNVPWLCLAAMATGVTRICGITIQAPSIMHPTPPRPRRTVPTRHFPLSSRKAAIVCRLPLEQRQRLATLLPGFCGDRSATSTR